MQVITFTCHSAYREQCTVCTFPCTVYFVKVKAAALLPNERPGTGCLSQATKLCVRAPEAFFKESYLFGDFNLLKKSVKKSFMQKIKQKTTATLVLFCFHCEKYRPKHRTDQTRTAENIQNSYI